MTEALLFAAIGVAALAAILALLRHPSSIAGRKSPGSNTEAGQFFPSHSRFFPQMQQALSADDEAFLARRGSPRLLKQWQAARKRAALDFLDGLDEDFARLTRLARTIARMTPEIDRQREAELFWLGLRFVVVSQLVRLRLRSGRSPRNDLQKLADLIGVLGCQMDRAASALVRDPSPGPASSLTP
jgi:hypothetical protein